MYQERAFPVGGTLRVFVHSVSVLARIILRAAIQVFPNEIAARLATLCDQSLHTKNKRADNLVREDTVVVPG